MKVEDAALLKRFGGPGLCERCNRWVAGRDAHHAFIKTGMGGGSRLDVPENLASLCRVPCHTLAEHDKGVEWWVQCLVAAREGRSPVAIKEWLWAVLRAPKGGPQPPRPWEKADGGTDGQTGLPGRPRDLRPSADDPGGDDGRAGGVPRRPAVGEAGGVPADEGGWRGF